MKLACGVYVNNRLLPTLAISNKRRHLRSTLALCKHSKNDEFYIVLFSGQDKNGTKYVVKDNLQRVHTRFLNEGKATIEFKNPQHDLCIQAEVVQIRAFLHLLKRALSGNVSSKELTFSSMGVTPIANKDLAPKKLVVSSASAYPRYFPRTLETLITSNICRTAFDKNILHLSKLRVLDLSHNLIKELPEELNRLNLTELTLSSNNLHESIYRKNWTWMSGNLSKTLAVLNLDSNNLKFLPNQIIRLEKLTNLNVNNNNLKTFPANIGNLLNLKFLSAANNGISVLPGSMGKLHLDTLDLSNNHLVDHNGPNLPLPRFTQIKCLQVLSLREIAARAVLNNRIHYGPGIVPITLVAYLDNAKYCVCGKACLEGQIKIPQFILLESIAKTFIVTVGTSTFVPADCFFCSVSCITNFVRYRRPIT